jgi:predicted nucleic acid-binding protein
MARRARGPVTRVAAFWDSSALVPLCVSQPLTQAAIALYKTYDAIVWWATPVEIASALARLVRVGQLDPKQWSEAQKLALTVGREWSVVQPSDSLRTKAIRLVERYDLRAADSLQLAAALAWCEDVPRGRVFLTADQRLREAVSLHGFEGKPL